MAKDKKQTVAPAPVPAPVPAPAQAVAPAQATDKNAAYRASLALRLGSETQSVASAISATVASNGALPEAERLSGEQFISRIVITLADASASRKNPFQRDAFADLAEPSVSAHKLYCLYRAETSRREAVEWTSRATTTKTTSIISVKAKLAAETNVKAGLASKLAESSKDMAPEVKAAMEKLLRDAGISLVA